MLTENILGYQVRRDGFESCLGEITRFLEQGQDQKWLATLNPHSYAVALHRPGFRSALNAADWLIPDGVGVVFASRIMGGTIRQRVSGPDMFYGLHDFMQRSGNYSVFFLGASEDTLAEIRQRMSKDWPDIRIAGTCSPPFKPRFSDEDIEQMVQSVNAARADVLWVGLTAPKQEELINRILPRLNVRFAGAVGAIFDFYAGRVKRSHPAFRRLGLEWLPRLLRDPRRLWRRMFVSAPIFMWHVCLARLKPARRAGR
ncbi:MAG: WecB/TagA/CpsF family glycosyltransferase [Gammaproteobacteria bacterium]|jgi:N-acetylglucosaminyldiphosphoundecaprenol N-acetyl-beta-D-mannosaminyltransferase|nr:WecB/TagA/CpsF family glycosyltransferase [Gammaproteobacteria bacterium]